MNLLIEWNKGPALCLTWNTNQEIGLVALLLEHSDVEDFVAYLRLKNLSERTIKEYAWVLDSFFRTCPTDIVSPRDLTFEHLRSYISGLQSRHLASKTVCDRVIILKRFFGYLAAEGRLLEDPAQRLPLPKVGKRLPKALTLDEMGAFLAVLSEEIGIGAARPGPLSSPVCRGTAR